jgi:hypothetical protein
LPVMTNRKFSSFSDAGSTNTCVAVIPERHTTHRPTLSILAGPAFHICIVDDPVELASNSFVIVERIL